MEIKMERLGRVQRVGTFQDWEERVRRQDIQHMW